MLWVILQEWEAVAFFGGVLFSVLFLFFYSLSPPFLWNPCVLIWLSTQGRLTAPPESCWRHEALPGLQSFLSRDEPVPRWFVYPVSAQRQFTTSLSLWVVFSMLKTAALAVVAVHSGSLTRISLSLPSKCAIPLVIYQCFCQLLYKELH